MLELSPTTTTTTAPTPPLPIWLQQFHQRLDTAEESFLQGEFLSSYHVSLAVLDDLLTLTSRTHTDNGGNAPVNAAVSLVSHVCVVQCICQAAVTLALQCMYELQQVDQLLPPLIHKYYQNNILHMPYTVFMVYLQLLSSLQRWDSVCKGSVAYLKEHSQPVSSAAQDGSRTTQQHTILTIDQYQKVIELLIFHGLLPLDLVSDASKLMEQNSKIDDKFAASIKRRMQRWQRQRQRQASREKDNKQQREEGLLQESGERRQKSHPPPSSHHSSFPALPLSDSLPPSTHTSNTQRHNALTHSTTRLLKLWKHVRMYVGHNGHLLFAVCLVLLLLSRLSRGKHLLDSSRWPMLDMMQRELRNLAHLAFSNMLGASISQTFSAM